MMMLPYCIIVGHGVREDSAGRFSDDYDGFHECLVAYQDNEGALSSSFSLVDIELRYLLSKINRNPHLVIILDCSYNSDFTRDEGVENDYYAKKEYGLNLDARDYSQFIFSEVISEEELKERPLNELFPLKNYIELTASNSNEPAWENDNGGVLTRYLVYLLQAHDNQLTYQEIGLWAKISLKNMTSKLQTPTIRDQGEGKTRANSPWLNLPKDRIPRKSPLISYNLIEEWVLSQGKILGISKGSIVILNHNNKKVRLKVTKAKLDTSFIEDPALYGIALDKSKIHPIYLVIS